MVCLHCQVKWPDNNRICQYCGQSLLTQAEAERAIAQQVQEGRPSLIEILIVFFIELRTLTLLEYLAFMGLVWSLVLIITSTLVTLLYGLV